MPKFTVWATLKTDLIVEIDADNLEEAQRIADYELITDDFTKKNVVFTLDMVVENEEVNA